MGNAELVTFTSYEDQAEQFFIEVAELRKKAWLR